MGVNKRPISKQKKSFRMPKPKRAEVAERRKKVLQIITEKPMITQKELAKLLGVTEEAVRRDLLCLSLEPETFSIVARHKKARAIAERRKMAILRGKVLALISKGVRSRNELAKRLGVGEQSIRNVISEINATGSWQERELISRLRQAPDIAVEARDPRQRKLIDNYLRKFNEWQQRQSTEISQELSRLMQEIKLKKGEERDLLQMEINALKKILENRKP